MAIHGEENVEVESITSDSRQVQNSFDPVDAAVNPDRQRHLFAFLSGVLRATLRFANKEEARTWFNRIRQKFLDWNSSEWKSDDFARIEKELGSSIEAQAKDGQ